MVVKLHFCGGTWIKSPHPCWQVQKALDESGTEYEVVKGPLRRGKRDRMQALTGQRLYPAIEFEDGSAYREQSKDMVATIRAGSFWRRHGLVSGLRAATETSVEPSLRTRVLAQDRELEPL